MLRKEKNNLGITVMLILGICFIAGAGYYYGQDYWYKRFTSEEYRVTMKYPPKWEVMTDKPGVVVVFVSPLENDLDYFRESVNIVVQNRTEEPMSLYKYSNTAIADLKMLFKANLVEIVSEPTFLAGYDAHKFVYLGKSPEQNYKFMHIWTIVNGYGFQVTFAAIPSRFDEYLPIAEKMFKSFRIL